MSIEFISGFIVLLLTLSIIGEPIAARLHLPHSSVLVLMGAAVAYFVTLGLGVDTGLRATSFHDLVFFILLPVLIFEAAFKIPLPELRENIGVVLFMAVAGMLVTTGLCAVVLYYAIGHPVGFPWIAALIAGALLAATDPVAVVAQLKTLGAPERLGVLLEGESLFNDATAIVVFSIFLLLATMPAAEVSFGTAIVQFVLTFSGGAVIGLFFGWLGVWLSRVSRDGITLAAITLAVAYGSFLIAEGVLHVSGVTASLCAGLVFAADRKNQVADSRSLDYFWSALAYLANGSVFLLVGVTITLTMFTERWLAMLIAIGAVILARAAATFGGFGLINLVVKERVSMAYQGVIVWGGLRGAVTLGLALSLPVELDYWFTIQSMAFGVVLFTLLVQAPSMPWLLQKTSLVKTTKP
jgi:CPA1 family monovalent cation:H+ antiporter